MSETLAQPAATGAASWRHRHLLDVADLSRTDLEVILDRAEEMRRTIDERAASRPQLLGRHVTILFYEASTRTRVSFEVAARRLSADVVNIEVASSSATKGESLADTVRTLEALGAEVLIVRHTRSGAAHAVASVFGGHVVNAGDGWHAHPTQALLDLFTLRRALGAERLLRGKIVIVGDVLHSRVARSNIWALTSFGAEVCVVGPATLLRGFQAWAGSLPGSRRLNVTTRLDEALRDADAVMGLRIQHERMADGLLPSLAEYRAGYQLTEERLALCRPDAPVLHPGPMNEGVEIEASLAAGSRSLVTEQVRNGVPVRMAVLGLLCSQDP